MAREDPSMTGNDQLTPPEPSAGDYVHALAKAGVAGIPVLGGPAAEIFAALVQPPLDRRRHEWMTEVGECLCKLEAERGVDLAELRDNDEFIDIVMHASQVALRTSVAEKREALRNAVLNTAIGQSPSDAMRHMYLTWIGDFTEWHLRVLKLFGSPGEWKHAVGGPNLSHMESNVKSSLNRAYPDLRQSPALRDMVISDPDRAVADSAPSTEQRVHRSPRGMSSAQARSERLRQAMAF